MTKKSRTNDPDLETRLISAALNYARRGWRVHPLRPGTKVPYLEEWQLLATTDPETIATWWGEHPRANIGLATGKASNLYVLDVDTKKGKVGALSLTELEADHGALPATYSATTASGGLHYYFRWPKGEGTWRNSASKVGADLDIRAEGGYVVAAPSTLREYGGAAYAPLTPEDDLARVPKWLAKKTRYEEAPATIAKVVAVADLSESDIDRARRYVDRAVAGITENLRALSEGSTDDGLAYSGPPWDNSTFDAAARLAEFAQTEWSPLTSAEAHEILLAEAPRDDGFTTKRVEAIWRSALRKVKGKQLPMPPDVSGGLVIPLVESSGEPSKKDRSSRYFDEKGNYLAERLAKAVSHDLAISLDGIVHSFKGGVWQADPDVIKGRLAKLLGDKYRPTIHSGVQDVVMTSDLPHLSGEPNADLINTKSGMYDWRSDSLLPHDPGHLSTIQLPIEWDNESSCAHFDRWLKQVVPHDSIPLMWEIIGYMMMSGNPLQSAILLHGDGGNGKGTLLRVLAAMAGSHNTSNVTLRQMAEGKFELAETYGKLANIAGDIDTLGLKDTSTFKSFTGNDRLLAQRKGGRPFFFVPFAVPIFSAQELWRSADTTRGYFRRWVPVSFPNVLSGRLDERKLTDEIPGIFRKSMKALRRLMARGEWELGMSSSLLMEEFKIASDIVRVWLSEDNSIIQSDLDAQGVTVWAPREALHRAFVDWARASEHGTMGSTKFFNRLRALHYVESRRASGMGFYGLRPLRLLASQPSGKFEMDIE